MCVKFGFMDLMVNVGQYTSPMDAMGTKNMNIPGSGGPQTQKRTTSPFLLDGFSFQIPKRSPAPQKKAVFHGLHQDFFSL